jgi:hypothetical protein
MRSTRSTVQISHDMEKWPGCKWVVVLHVSNRQVVESVNATCHRIDASAHEQLGFASNLVGPFDDLNAHLRMVLTESALDSIPDPDDYLEVELPFDPFTP